MNRSTIFIILAAVLVPVIVYWLTRRKTVLEKRIDKALSSGQSIWTHLLVDVAREVGTCNLTDEQLDAIDTGLQFTFDKARRRGWKKGLNHSLFVVVILKGEMHKGVNVLRLPNGDYVAGIVVDLKKYTIAIPEHQPDQLKELARIIGYEAEHILAFQNDRELYERTKIHKEGEGHPIF